MKRFTDGVFKIPTEYEKYDELGCLDHVGGEWLVNKELYITLVNKELKKDIYNKMDVVLNHIIKNENKPSYKNSSDYLKYKEQYELELEELEAQLKEI